MCTPGHAGPPQTTHHTAQVVSADDASQFQPGSVAVSQNPAAADAPCPLTDPLSRNPAMPPDSQLPPPLTTLVRRTPTQLYAGTTISLASPGRRRDLVRRGADAVLRK